MSSDMNKSEVYNDLKKESFKDKSRGIAETKKYENWLTDKTSIHTNINKIKTTYLKKQMLMKEHYGTSNKIASKIFENESKRTEIYNSKHKTIKDEKVFVDNTENETKNTSIENGSLKSIADDRIQLINKVHLIDDNTRLEIVDEIKEQDNKRTDSFIKSVKEVATEDQANDNYLNEMYSTEVDYELVNMVCTKDREGSYQETFLENEIKELSQCDKNRSYNKLVFTDTVTKNDCTAVKNGKYLDMESDKNSVLTTHNGSQNKGAKREISMNIKHERSAALTGERIVIDKNTIPLSPETIINTEDNLFFNSTPKTTNDLNWVALISKEKINTASNIKTFDPNKTLASTIDNNAITSKDDAITPLNRKTKLEPNGIQRFTTDDNAITSKHEAFTPLNNKTLDQNKIPTSNIDDNINSSKDDAITCPHSKIDGNIELTNSQFGKKETNLNIEITNPNLTTDQQNINELTIVDSTDVLIGTQINAPSVTIMSPDIDNRSFLYPKESKDGSEDGLSSCKMRRVQREFVLIMAYGVTFVLLVAIVVMFFVA